MPIRAIAAGLLGVSLFATGCVAPDDPISPWDERTAEEASELRPIRTTVPIGANGLDPADFWAAESRAAFRALGGAALLGGGGALVPTPLLGTARGRSVLDYTIRCALPSGQVARGPGGEEFYGEFGFAPAWAGRALTTSEQRWVSACIFQHLNGSGEHVEILLRGGHPSLECDMEEEPFSEFVLHDATMYGNAFLPGGIVGYACIDLDLTGQLSALSLSCPLDLSVLSLQRLCGHGLGGCGIALVGLCELACTSDAAGGRTCHTLPLGQLLGPLLGPAYAETIQTELRDSDLLPLYPSCGLL